MTIATTLRRPPVLASLGVLVVLLAAVAVWFKPWGLIVNETVAEAAPTAVAVAPTAVAVAPTAVAAARATPSTAGNPAATSGPVPVAPPAAVPLGLDRTGSFVAGEHEISGTVRFIPTKEGVILRLADLQTANGPDVHVYLSTRTNGKVGPGDLQVAPLKGNRGNQNYLLNVGTDVSRYRSVVIWCARFHVGFGHAVLSS